MANQEIQSNYPRVRRGICDEELEELRGIAIHDSETLIPLGFIFLAGICLLGLWGGVPAIILTYSIGVLYGFGFSGTMIQMAGWYGNWSFPKRTVARIAVSLLTPIGVGWFVIRAVRRVLPT
ncbi:MAG TPA: hypothetical protein VK171_11575 [Fimbriimonas sp.]|nr:hypothetical protein [Fimbriimonas sp.]